MHITYVSLFPELFESFRNTTLISKSIENKIVTFETINPRHFCDDKHRITDDEIYGWGHGLLMKAPPIIAAVKHWMKKHKLVKSWEWKVKSWKKIITNLWWKDTEMITDNWSLLTSFKIIIPHPSQNVFNQSYAHDWSEYYHLLFICWRYEGIDERVRLWLQKKFPDNVVRISLGHFVTLWGELPVMTMTEAVVRLIPGVINTEMSRKDESYSIDCQMNNIEHPQYTRPEIVEGMRVPEVLLSGHHKKIEEWKKEKSKRVEE